MDSTTVLLSLLLGVVSAYAVVITSLYLKRSRPERATARSLPEHSGTSDSEKRLQEKADEALKLSRTFQKFVPRQFVDHFAKHGSMTLELGHADEDEVAILFCDIRGFTGLSERMSPQELMNFLNSYFLRMNDPIHRNGGFIDKFIGDAIMALFDHPNGQANDKTQDAIQAALDLRSAIEIYNTHRANSGYEAINIGIGIHYGPVIIGTVGSDDRMDTTVIGDSVNIASRLEGLSPVYQADIIVSANVLDTLDTDMDVCARLLDWVRVKGRQAPIRIYEVLSHLSLDEQINRLKVEPLIEQSLNCRCRRDWEGALDVLETALAVSENDPLIQHHIATVKKLAESKLPSHWDGALEF